MLSAPRAHYTSGYSTTALWVWPSRGQPCRSARKAIHPFAGVGEQSNSVRFRVRRYDDSASEAARLSSVTRCRTSERFEQDHVCSSSLQTSLFEFLHTEGHAERLGVFGFDDPAVPDQAAVEHRMVVGLSGGGICRPVGLGRAPARPSHLPAVVSFASSDRTRGLDVGGTRGSARPTHDHYWPTRPSIRSRNRST